MEIRGEDEAHSLTWAIKCFSGCDIKDDAVYRQIHRLLIVQLGNLIRTIKSSQFIQGKRPQRKL